jgi:hypothetical protein
MRFGIGAIAPEHILIGFDSLIQFPALVEQFVSLSEGRVNLSVLSIRRRAKREQSAKRQQHDCRDPADRSIPHHCLSSASLAPAAQTARQAAVAWFQEASPASSARQQGVEQEFHTKARWHASSARRTAVKPVVSAARRLEKQEIQAGGALSFRQEATAVRCARRAAAFQLAKRAARRHASDLC